MEKQNDPTLQPLLLTVPQVAKRLGLSRAMIYILINREGLPVIRLGRAVRISATTLQNWVEEREQSSLSLVSHEKSVRQYADVFDASQKRVHPHAH